MSVRRYYGSSGRTWVATHIVSELQPLPINGTTSQGGELTGSPPTDLESTWAACCRHGHANLVGRGWARHACVCARRLLCIGGCSHSACGHQLRPSAGNAAVHRARAASHGRHAPHLGRAPPVPPAPGGCLCRAAADPGPQQLRRRFEHSAAAGRRGRCGLMEPGPSVRICIYTILLCPPAPSCCWFCVLERNIVEARRKHSSTRLDMQRGSWCVCRRQCCLPMLSMSVNPYISGAIDLGQVISRATCLLRLALSVRHLQRA